MVDPNRPRCKRSYQLSYCRATRMFQTSPETCAVFERLLLKVPVRHPRAPPVVEVRIGNERALGAVIGERTVLTAEPLAGAHPGIEVRTLRGRRIAVSRVTLHPGAPLALLELSERATGTDVSHTDYSTKDFSALRREQALQLFGFDTSTGRIGSQKLPPRFVVYYPESTLRVWDIDPATLRIPQGAPLLTLDGQLAGVKVMDARQTLITREKPGLECAIDALIYELVPVWRTGAVP